MKIISNLYLFTRCCDIIFVPSLILFCYAMWFDVGVKAPQRYNRCHTGAGGFRYCPWCCSWCGYAEWIITFVRSHTLSTKHRIPGSHSLVSSLRLIVMLNYFNWSFMPIKQVAIGWLLSHQVHCVFSKLTVNSFSHCSPHHTWGRKPRVTIQHGIRAWFLAI